MMGLNQCQWRWWKHFSPQRKTENPTSTENTAPDMQKALGLLTEAATDRQRRDPKGSRGPLKAAHALKQNDFKEDKDGWRETTGARPISHFLLNHVC